MATLKSNSIKLPPRLIATSAPVSDVGYRKTDGDMITDQETRYFNTSVNALRQLNTTQAIRILTRIDGTFSAAINSYLQLAMSSGFRVTAYKAGTHQFDPQATLAAMSVISSMDTLYDYTEGYSDKQSLSGSLETLLKEVLQTGGCMAELVLNKYKLPEQIVAIPLNTIDWLSTKQGKRIPRQNVASGGDPILLDYPTILYASAAQQSNSVFPRSPFESALNMLYMYKELLEDIFRVIRRTGHTRLVVKVIQEAIQNMAPADILDDPQKMAKFFDDTRRAIQTTITELKPEDAIVLFDSAELDSVASNGDKADYTAILETMNGMLASSLKIMPSMLGMRMAGSQSLSNTESLTFLKMVAGIRLPVETVMSRAMTLAVRLLAGTDAYVEFRFKSIELRTDSELSAHKSVIQQDVMRKLSLGYLTDDEAAHMLDMFPRAPGAPDLSGTGFMDKTPVVQPKDIVTEQDGAAQKSGNEGTANGPPPSNGGGNPNG